MDIGYTRLYSQEAGICGRSRPPTQEWHRAKVSAGVVSLQKVNAKGVVLPQDMLLWVLEAFLTG